MAYRRMISKSISISEQVNEMSDFSCMLFTWMISHADDWGILPGSPKVVKALVIPMRNNTEEDVEKALQEMVNNDLIYWYEVEGTKYVQFKTWEKHQQGLNKRTASKYPSYEDYLKFREVLGNSEKFPTNRTELEQNRIEQKGIELEHVDDVGSSFSPPEKVDDALKKVTAEYENSGYGTIDGTTVEKLIDYVDEYSAYWVILALKEGALRGKRYLKYVEGILKNWKADGIPTLENEKGQPRNKGMPKNVQSGLDLVEKYKREEESQYEEK